MIATKATVTKAALAAKTAIKAGAAVTKAAAAGKPAVEAAHYPK